MKRPEWWTWELAFTSHVESRMEERGLSEVELRAMLGAAALIEPARRPGRFLVRASRAGEPWIVVVEPDPDDRRLVVVTVYRRGEPA